MIAARFLPTALMLSFCVSSAVAQDAPVPAPVEPPAPAAPEPAESSSRAEPPASTPAAAEPVSPPAQVAPAPIPAQPIAPYYAVPAPGALPAPPVGQPFYYGYSPQDELTAIDTRLAELRLQRPGLGGPIALIAAGGGVAFVGAYVAMIAWVADETDVGVSCYRSSSDYDDDGGYHCERTEDDRRLVRGMALFSLTGLATLVGGLVWMSNRSKARRVLKPEINALKARRNYLLRNVRYGLNAEPGRYGMSVGAAL